MSRTLKKPEMNIIKALLRPVNTTAIMILGIYTMVWGFWLANPFWEVFTRAPLYTELENAFDVLHVSSEFTWGMIAIIAGAIINYGALRPSYGALTRGSAVAFIHWFVIAIFYFWGDWQNTGGITSLTFAVYAIFIYANIRVNYRNGNHQIEDLLN